MTLAAEQARFAADLRFGDLPADVVTSVEARVLDTIGLMLAATALEPGLQVVEVARSWGGPAEATAGILGERLPAQTAALVNGTLAHALDFDDTHLPSILHPSAVIVPTALACSQAAGKSGRDTIAAACVGYELVVRLGMAAYDERVRNNVFFERGLHATSICGTLAGAAVAAKLYELDARGIEAAIGIAASMGAGLLEANRVGGSVKRLHCGWAAHAAIAAAQFARAGFTAPATVLEGRFGFFQALCGGQFDPAAVTTGLGERWETPGIHFKPYPANHFTHAGIDGALALRARGIEPDHIERLELGVASPTLRTIAEPVDAKARPPSGYAAQFSGPFAVAAALAGGGGLGVSLEDFTDERARDPRLLALAARVTCHADPECDAIYPNALPAVVRAILHDGTVIEERVLENRGGPARPLSHEQLTLKFQANAARAPINRTIIDEIHDTCRRLAELDSIDELATKMEAR